MEPASAHGLLGTFNNKHRTGLDGTLHRISVMTGAGGVVTGLTYRVGRHKEGAAPARPERIALCSIAVGIQLP